MRRDTTTLNTWAIAVVRTLDAMGIDGRALLRRAGLDPAVLEQPGGRYPVAQMQGFWRLAVTESGDAALGLKAAAHVQPATFHSLGLAILASQSLADAMQRAARYSTIVSDSVELRSERGDGVFRQVARVLPDAPVADEAIDLCMASVLKIGRMLLGIELRPLALHLRRAAAPALRAEFAAHFGCPVYFGDRENALLIPGEWADRPLPMANPLLARQNDRIVMDYLARYDAGRVAERVRAELISRLPSGEPARAAVAQALHLSEKTLQRRLRDEGTSYQQLLEETRRELAQDYLREGRVSVSEVTFRLGFSDQSSFSRAFKRWTGIAPGEFRKS